MNEQTPTDNDRLFRASRHKQETPKATGASSWLNRPRDGFTAYMTETRLPEMKHSSGAKQTNGGITVGGFKSVTGGK